MKKKSSGLLSSNISIEQALKKSSETSKISIEKSLKKMNSMVQIVAVFRIIIFSVFLSYVLNLEKDKCKCSKGWERNYIKYFSLLVIIFSLIEIFSIETFYKLHVIHYIIGLGSVIFIYSIIKYVHELKKEDCQCSTNWKRSLLNLYAWIEIAIIIISIILIFFMRNRIKS